MQTLKTRQKTAHVRSAARVFVSATGCLLAGGGATGIAHAQLVDFSAVSLTAVSSAAGQNFTVGGDELHPINARLISGSLTNLIPGASPDTTGFYAAQNSGNLTPATIRFSFTSLPRTFVVTQNETLTNLENNGFTLSSGAWTVLSYSNATLTTSNGGSQVAFQGTINSSPYGTYQIQGAGSYFDFNITNSPGIQDYGSAISLRLTGFASTSAPEPGSIVFALMSGTATAAAFGARNRHRRSRRLSSAL